MMEMLTNLSYCLGQAIILLLLAPMVAGIVKKLKAFMQNRVGSSIFQDYYDIYKWRIRRRNTARKYRNYWSSLYLRRG